MNPSSLCGLRAWHALLFGLTALASFTNAQIIKSEAEKIPVWDKFGSQVHVTWTSGTRMGINYEPTQNDDAIKYWLNIREPGTYNIWVCHRKYNNRGLVQHAINGVNQGTVFNSYYNATGPTDPNVYQRIHIGTKVFNEPGIKSFELISKGAGTEGGRIISVDYIEVEKVPGTGTPAWEYTDDFENETAGQSPSHWIELNTADEWKVDSTTGSKTYRHPANSTSTVSWLHVFERDVELTARAMAKTSSGKIGLVVRHNHDESGIRAGHDGTKWYIMDRDRQDGPAWELLGSVTEALTLNQWYTLRVVVRGSDVALYVNDMEHPKIFANDDLSHISPGRVGLLAEGREAHFDDIQLQLVNKQGRVQDGVLEYTIQQSSTTNREGASLIVMPNGTLEMVHRGERFYSTDSGKTFTGPVALIWPEATDTESHHQFLRLRPVSGQPARILRMLAEYGGADGNGLRYWGYTWTDGQPQSSWVKGSAPTWTNFPTIVMPGDTVASAQHKNVNDKLTQLSDGKIILATTVRLPDSRHKTVVYYSVNNGFTWTRSTNDTENSTGGAWQSYGEGKVIETTSPNHLRLYVAWNTANYDPAQPDLSSGPRNIRYAESSNGGVSWEFDKSMADFKCARSSLGLCEDFFAATRTYYMVWCYDEVGNAMYPDYGTGPQWPRSRLALARSFDGVNWDYMMDIDRWIGVNDGDDHPVVQFIDPGITTSQNYLYVTAGRSEKDVKPTDPDGAAWQAHNAARLRVYRIDKTKLTPWPARSSDNKKWPDEY